MLPSVLPSVRWAPALSAALSPALSQLGPCAQCCPDGHHEKRLIQPPAIASSAESVSRAQLLKSKLFKFWQCRPTPCKAGVPSLFVSATERCRRCGIRSAWSASPAPWISILDRFSVVNDGSSACKQAGYPILPSSMGVRSRE